MKRWMKITLGVVGGIVVLGALLSLGGDDAPPAESASETPALPQGAGAAGEEDAKDDAGATPSADEGCAGERHCVRLTLLGAERKECLGEHLCADAGMEYLVTRVRVENAGTAEVETNTFFFEAQREGVKHDADSSTFFVDGGMQLVTLQQGGAQEGGLVFRVPKGAPVKEVCFEPPTFTFGAPPRACAPLPA